MRPPYGSVELFCQSPGKGYDRFSSLQKQKTPIQSCCLVPDNTLAMLSTEDLIQKFAEKKIPRFRALQVIHAICKEGKSDYDLITTLPAGLKENLKAELPIFCMKLVRSMRSKDGSTEKALFELHDGLKVEAVLMRYEDARNTVCVSSQAGCQLGCTFCATGTMKFGRNLTYEEIADQMLFFNQKLHIEGKHVTNVVFMGMGEPFMNYDQVMKAVHVMHDPEGLDLGARNITLSTSGICEGIEKLTEEDLPVNLAVSLHAPNQTLRQKIMPIARKYSLEQLMAAIKNYLEVTRRRVSYEYVMLKGINDGEKEAYELADLIKGQLCHVNLIPYNATDIKGIEGSQKSNIRRFCDILLEKRIAATIRVTLGQDIAAACGQLANKNS